LAVGAVAIDFHGGAETPAAVTRSRQPNMTATVGRREPRGHDFVAAGIECRSVDGAPCDLPVVRSEARWLRPAGRGAYSNRDIADLRRTAIAIHHGLARGRQCDIGATAIAHEVIDHSLFDHVTVSCQKRVAE